MIRILSKEVADQIAAGEVVERPVSIVKELMENSIDAGADTIVCEIQKGGRQRIRITDNGRGIPADQVETAFLRHATSKISETEDLGRLSTLGFRGEALASIAAVTKVEIFTKTADQKAGYRLVIHGGEVMEQGGIGCPDGTTIIVEDLFYNTPARRKFLKSDSGEAAQISAVMKNIALAYPDLRIRMINGGRTLFSTRGSGRLADVIVAVEGMDAMAHLLPVAGEKEGLKLEGYVSDPGVSHPSRRYQVYFVNGRNVDSKVMERGVALAYGDRLFAGRHPRVYLFLTVDPQALDVNIHPNKRQVRFDDEVSVAAFIRNAIQQALSTRDAVPNVFDKDESFSSSHLSSGPSDPAEIPSGKDSSPTKNDREDFGKLSSSSHLSSGPSDPAEIPSGNNSPKSSIRQHISENISYGDERERKVEAVLDGYRQEKAERLAEEQLTYGTKMELEKAGADSAFDVAALEILGSVFDTYLLATDEETLYLIDQHAAHERINFEKILDHIRKQDDSTQMMLTPITLDAGFPDDAWTKPLGKVGYQIEEFGPSTWIVKGIPSWMEPAMADAFLKEYMDTVDVDDPAGSTDSDLIWDRAAQRACKASVKGGDSLKGEEMDRLLTDLARCENPFSCPHGRPTLIRIGRSEIEKRFKRV